MTSKPCQETIAMHTLPISQELRATTQWNFEGLSWKQIIKM